MADTGIVVRITANGANVAVIDSKLFAALLPEPYPQAGWDLHQGGEGRIQLQEQGTGRYLSVPNTEPLATQAEVTSTDANTPNSQWIAYRLNEDDSKTQTDKILESGMVMLKLAGTDLYLGRNLVEDRSLNPKRLVLTSEKDGQTQLIFQVQG
ncbi:hypothetical protein P8605_00140 [Streptomyces sp. T-3]|nr:hypothetical protein [Streptomyces sp. T-3]